MKETASRSYVPAAVSYNKSLCQFLPCKLDDGVEGFEGIVLGYVYMVVGGDAVFGTLFVTVVHRAGREAYSPAVG